MYVFHFDFGNKVHYAGSLPFSEKNYMQKTVWFGILFFKRDSSLNCRADTYM